MTALKKMTVRLLPDLDAELTDYAKREDISKNQAIKKAVRGLLKSKGGKANE